MTSPGFASFTSFTITSGLVRGDEHLGIRGQQSACHPNPTGLRVDLTGYLSIQPVRQPMLTVRSAAG